MAIILQHKSNWTFLLIYYICFLSLQCSQAQLAQWLSPYLPLVPGGIGDSTSTGLVYRQREILNETTGTILEWRVTHGNVSVPSSITFNFTTRSNSINDGNYIVLGLSRMRHLEGADVAMIQYLQRGIPTAELLDMYGSDNATISIDRRQNWRLNEVIWASPEGNSNSVSLIISRNLDTCDEDQDIPINNDMLHVIWGSGRNSAFGVTSVEFIPEGSVRAYLADPVRPNVTSAETPLSQETWRVSRSFTVPARRTSYWCTIHRGPSLQQRRHIIGYAPYFSNSTSERHVHHQLVYRCLAPPGVDASLIFDRYVNHPGEECYLEQSHQLPTHLCAEILHIWAVGGKPFTFPQNLGMSIGEDKNEYFMFESHYDNPEMRDDIVVENGVDFYHSSEIRSEEGGIIFLGSGVLGLYMVPPNTPNFKVGGQCSSRCTTEMLTGVGGGGADILATMLHAHTTTRKVRVKHFRGGQELPWIQNDDNYDFSFQQMRHVPRPVKVLPGDQLGVECGMNTTFRNNMTLSGFSTLDEMCVTFVVVNKRLGYLYCSSEYPTSTTLNRYGIRNVTWDRQLQERIINQADDESLVGQTFQSVLDNGNLEVWTEERKRELENEQLRGQHNSICPPIRKLSMMAYATYFVEGVTKGIISLSELIENNRPSTRRVDTPGPPVTPAVWPTPFSQYQPTSQCAAR